MLVSGMSASKEATERCMETTSKRRIPRKSVLHTARVLACMQHYKPNQNRSIPQSSTSHDINKQTRHDSIHTWLRVVPGFSHITKARTYALTNPRVLVNVLSSTVKVHEHTYLLVCGMIVHTEC